MSVKAAAWHRNSLWRTLVTSASVLAALSGCAQTPARVTAPVGLQASLAWTATPRMNHDRATGCFVGQMEDTPWAVRAAQASVEIVTVGQKDAFVGSGFVVRDSATSGDPRNKIMTAFHVVKTIADKGGLVGILSAAGQPIGWARIIAHGQPGKERERDGQVLPRGDQAVLTMVGFFPGGEQVFDAIEGVDLAPTQSRTMLSGTFTKPAGIEFGASGAPVFDTHGRVIGMVERKVMGAGEEKENWSVRAKVHAAQAAWSPSAKEPVIRFISQALPASSVGYAEPIADVNILGSLGAAGMKVNLSEPAPVSYDEVEIPAYPLQVCVVYHGRLSRAAE